MIKPLFFTRVSKTNALDAEIALAEQSCGFKFPTAFVEFCQEYNGGFPDEKSEHFPVPEKYADFYSEYQESGILLAVLYGLTTDPEPCNVFRAQQHYAQFSIPFFPLAGDWCGNYVIINKDDPEGPVFFEDHGFRLFQIADSAEEFYNRLGQDPNEDQA